MASAGDLTAAAGVSKRLRAPAFDEIVSDFPQPIRDQAIHSVALFAWAKYDRPNAPKMEFLNINSIERHLARRSENATAQPPEEAIWEAILEKYKYTRTDNFDFVLMKCVDSMVIDVDGIQKEALALQEQQRVGALHGKFESAWRRFHDSFDDDENKVVEQIVDCTRNAFEVVSLANLNEAMALLKSLNRDAEAAELLDFFSDNRDRSYWTTEDPFGRGPFLPEVDAVVKKKSEVEPEEFDLGAALVTAGENYDAPTITKLAAVPAQTYFELISVARGAQLRKLVLSALEFRRIANATDDMKRVIDLMEEALRMVGRTSRLNAIRIKKYGVSI
jgi:hypothetical protein